MNFGKCGQIESAMNWQLKAVIACLLPVECKDSHCGLSITKDFQESAGMNVESLAAYSVYQRNKRILT